MDKCIKFLYLIAIGCFMCTIKEWNFLPEVILGNRFIGKKHKVFNDIRCNISLIWMNIYRISLIVYDDLRFRKIEVDRTSFSTLFL